MSSWNNLTPLQTSYISRNVVRHGTSIWISTDYNHGERGMVQFDTNSKKIANVIKYPGNMQPDAHSICFCANLIYIVDGANGVIFTFNPYSKRFAKKLEITKLGDFTNCIVINNHIHIFNGIKNSKYLIYSPTSNKMLSYKEPHKHCNMIEQGVLDTNNGSIIRIGGISKNYNFMSDLFYSTSSNNINWKEVPQYKLPRGICGSGLVSYKDYIIMFGGCVVSGIYTDDIYVLNLKNKYSTWKKLDHLKCPFPSKYNGILMRNGDIHLFTLPLRTGDLDKHYSISILSVLPELREESHDDNNNDDQKCNNCDKLNAKINILNQQKYQSDEEIQLYKTKTASMQLQIDQLTREKSQFNAQQTQLMQQIEQYRMNEVSLKQQVRNVKQRNDELNDECKQSKMELIEFKKELQKLKRSNIDTTKFLEWTADEFVDWICSLEQGKFEKYEDKLRQAFVAEDIVGEAIPYIEKKEWKEWGVTSYMDRTNLDKYVKNLINANNINQQKNIAFAASMNNNYNEGGHGTAYI